MAAEQRLDGIRAALDASPEGWGERGEVMCDAGLDYVDDDPVQIRVRKRGHRCELSDEGGATRRSGRPRGWLEVAERLAAREGVNVNRRGAVFVPAVEGRDLAPLVVKLAGASREIFIALLELRDR